VVARPAMERVHRSSFASTSWRLRGVGAALLFATGGIHLDLYLTGYRSIPTIGTLFIVQVGAAFILGLAALAIRRPIVAISGALFAVATLGGYVLSLWFGLFGFKEVRTSAGIAAGIVEIGAFAALSAATLLDPSIAPGADGSSSFGRLVTMGRRGVVALGVVAAAVLAVALIGASTPTTASQVSGGSATSGPVVRVTIHDFAFAPSRVVTAPGERIAVTNRDGVAHTFSSAQGDKFAFTSGPIVPNATRVVVAPMTPGTYPYLCQIHPFMTGTLVVTG
jgi:plastocyanin